MTDYPIKVKIESGSAKPGRDEVVRLLSDIRDASKKTADSLDQIGKKGKKSMDDASKSGTVLKNVLGSLFTLATVRQAILMADTYNNIQNRLRLVTTGTENLAAVTNELFNISERTRSSFESTAELYSRTARSVKDLGLSQKETLEFTEALNKAAIISGGSMESQNAALIQLSQGLASGALRGDELRSVMEQLPRVTEVLTEGLGITTGELRKLGAEGKITANDIIIAFKKAGTTLDLEFAKTVPTVSQAFTVLRNALMETLGEFDKANGITKGFAEVIIFLAKNMDTVVKVMVVVGSAILASFVPAIMAGVRAIALMTATALKNPFVLLATGIAALIQYAGGLRAAWEYLKIGTAAIVGEFIKFGNILWGIAKGAVVGFIESITYLYDLLFEFGAGLNNFINNPFGSGNFDGLKKKLEVGFVGSFVKAFDETMLEAEAFNKQIDENTSKIVDRALANIDKIKSEKDALGSVSSETGTNKTKTALSDEENQYLETKKQLLENIIGPQQTYNDSMRALNEYLAEGTINQQQYNEAWAQVLNNFNNAQIPTTFGEGFSQQLIKMTLETRNATAQIGKMFAEIFGPGGTVTKGIGDAVAQSIVFGKSWKESISDTAKTILSQLISAFAQIGVQMLANFVLGQTLSKANTLSSAAEAAAIASAWAPAAAATSVATFGGSAAAGTTGLLAAFAAAAGAIVPRGFQDGGYTGNMGVSDVAGVVHGQEFVVNASATKRNRGLLEAMNSGKTPANNNGMNVTVINNAPGVEHSVNQLSNGDVEIIARRVVREEAPKVIASDIANPNSHTSKSLSQNTKTERKRV